MVAFLDVVRFSLPVIGLLAAGAAVVAAAFYGVTLVIEKLVDRGKA